MTTHPPEVRPSRSSRTREESSQVSAPAIDRRPTILLHHFCDVPINRDLYVAIEVRTISFPPSCHSTGQVQRDLAFSL